MWPPDQALRFIWAALNKERLHGWYAAARSEVGARELRGTILGRALLRLALWILLAVMSASLVGACCTWMGNFGGGPCTGSSSGSGRLPPEERSPYRYRIHLECSGPIELDVAEGERAAKDGDAKARADVATPNADYTKAPGTRDVCEHSAEPALSLWVRMKGAERFQSYVIRLDENRRNVMLISCPNSQIVVREAHPKGRGSACEEPLEL